MAVIPIYIAREELDLGMFVSDDAIELLEAGFLRADDVFWTDHSATRRRLSELKSYAEGMEPSLLQKVKGGMFTAAGAVLEGASVVHDKVTALTGNRRADLNYAKAVVLEGYLPRIKEAVISRLKHSAQSAEAALRDEVFMRKLFGAVYDTLPKPVCRFVTEEGFIEFCFKHRNRLLGDAPTHLG
jgi:hypothetical protein